MYLSLILLTVTQSQTQACTIFDPVRQALAACNAKVGEYCPPGYKKAVECPEGHVCTGDGFLRPCTADFGEYCREGKVQSCPKGFYSVSQGTFAFSTSPCEPCEAGKYSIANAGNASTDCQICPPGTYSGAGSTSCSHCQAGKFAFSTSPINTTSTLLCTSSESTNACEVVFSSFSLDMQMARVLVTIEIANTDFGGSNEHISSITVGGTRVGGHYLEHDGVDDECTKMSRVLDAVPVEMVDAGPPVVKIEASSAVDAYPCAGSYLYATVTLSFVSAPCKKCDVGTFSDVPGLPDCMRCPEGTYAAVLGSTLCTQCEPGKYESISGQSVCTNCSAGTFSHVSGSLMCLSCEAGKHVSVPGSTHSSDCTYCQVGKYAGNGSSECEPCEASAGRVCLEGSQSSNGVKCPQRNDWWHRLYCPGGEHGAVPYNLMVLAGTTALLIICDIMFHFRIRSPRCFRCRTKCSSCQHSSNCTALLVMTCLCILTVSALIVLAWFARLAKDMPELSAKERIGAFAMMVVTLVVALLLLCAFPGARRILKNKRLICCCCQQGIKPQMYEDSTTNVCDGCKKRCLETPCKPRGEISYASGRLIVGKLVDIHPDLRRFVPG